MERIPRIHIEDGVYYVTARGDHNGEIFKEEQDYRGYLSLLKKYKEQYGFKLFAFVLLSTQLLLLIELREGITLSEIMHDLNGNYTKYFNKKNSLKGHLFQETYKMNLLEKNQYLLYMSAYVHLYPQWLNSAPQAAGYPYSSYPVYLYYAGFNVDYVNTEPELFGLDLGMKQEVGEVLSTIKEKDYAGYLRSIPREEIKILAQDLKKRIVLGSEEFKEAARSRIKAYWREKCRQEMFFLQQRLSDLEEKGGKAGEWVEEFRHMEGIK